MFVHVHALKFAAVLAAVSLLGVAGPVQAAVPCGTHDVMAEALSTKFKEVRRVTGVLNAKAVMEIFMSPQGTWTVLVTNTNGIACIVAAGQDWQEDPVKPAGLDS
jgi:hypothetical protein